MRAVVCRSIGTCRTGWSRRWGRRWRSRRRSAGGWLVELLEDYGYAPHLGRPLWCKAIASARLKNDQFDARSWRSCCARICADTPVPVRTIRRQVHGGACAARNDAIDAASGRWLLFGDDDCVFQPHYAAGAAYTLARLTEADPAACGVTLPFYYRALRPRDVVPTAQIGRLEPDTAWFSTRFHAFPAEYLGARGRFPLAPDDLNTPVEGLGRRFADLVALSQDPRTDTGCRTTPGEFLTEMIGSFFAFFTARSATGGRAWGVRMHQDFVVAGNVHSLSLDTSPAASERRQLWRDGLARGARVTADHPHRHRPGTDVQAVLNAVTDQVGEPRITAC